MSPADGNIKYRNITYPYINITDQYYIDVAIGTPKVSYAHALLDMSSDLIWTNCDSSKSTTSTVIPCPRECSSLLGNLECPKECSYNFTYDDQDSTQVALARDYFTLGNLTLEKPLDIVFGCGTQNNGFFSNLSGIIGLGRGNLSLVSQMGYGNFSYCLNSNYSDISPLFLVSQPNLYGNQVNSTPLIRNPHYTSAYYVNLIGISVDSKRLRIPSSTFSLQPDGSGGVLLDSAKCLRFLLWHCILSAGPMWCCSRTITWIDMTNGLLCLTMLPSDGISVLGNLQQADKHIFFDLKNSVFSFQTVNCSAFS
ncbi:aspartic proteinase nepenthesin-2-like [Typha latifolia]|uniref:aspartic proteinase nepenthesin-2-like n=1 Tax=Typha latifolia TaxID=4733 RepID=UPI003C2DA588